MITLAFVVFGFFDAVVVFVAVCFCFGDEGWRGSLLALLLFTPFAVGSISSSAAFRLDFVVASGFAGGDATGFAAFLVAVFVVAVFEVALVFEAVAFEAVFEATFTPFT